MLNKAAAAAVTWPIFSCIFMNLWQKSKLIFLILLLLLLLYFCFCRSVLTGLPIARPAALSRINRNDSGILPLLSVACEGPAPMGFERSQNTMPLRHGWRRNMHGAIVATPKNASHRSHYSGRTAHTEECHWFVFIIYRRWKRRAMPGASVTQLLASWHRRQCSHNNHIYNKHTKQYNINIIYFGEIDPAGAVPIMWAVRTEWLSTASAQRALLCRVNTNDYYYLFVWCVCV